ncbi:DUF2249 domain-containing protein [Desertivirga brevis]|uniref:DUF2249 domain-containing protein n=1 Tax=Desertivirga brevis TaxID=2810310 RepID=UPI001A965478|nr:DUF2249 domain-containing protein [Pedobacter sp. SYSU D00873]
MTINGKTTIKALLEVNQDEVIQALEKLNRNFRRLRNPALRKLLAKRVSISDACRIANCKEEEFLKSMKEIGFEVNNGIVEMEVEPSDAFVIPDKSLVVELDVRPVISANQDPLKIILQQIERLNENQCLKLINSFEPLPLISLLGKKGYESYTERVTENVVITYFKKSARKPKEDKKPDETCLLDAFISFDNMLARYRGKLKEIDVRHLEMPGPMVTILEQLETLKYDEALFVHHKKVPVYLIPHLSDKGFEYLIQEENSGKISLLIYKR